MTMNAIPALRLHAQAFSPPAFASPDAVVRHLGAMQAQDYHQAVWALGVRLPGASLHRIEAALEAGTVIRTWPMRGTIHFVPPDDAGWMLRLTGQRMIEKDGRRQAQLGLDAETLARCADILGAALSTHPRLTRAEMFATLEAHGIVTGTQRGYHILFYLAHTGLIAIGPTVEKQQTFMLLERAAPAPRHLAGDEAWAELARRYLTSHGPATPHDFAWWAGVTVTEARRAVAMLGDALVSESFGGVAHWRIPGDARSPAEGVFLLPGFDEYFLGYKDRTAVIDPAHLDRICPGGNGVFNPMVVVDGRIVGRWSRTLRRNDVRITVEHFPGVPATDPALLSAAAARYADFHGLPHTLHTVPAASG